MPLITLEGIDGSGKTTQAKLLRCALECDGVETFLTREPGGTPLAEQLRELLMGAAVISPTVQALLFTAARRDHIEQVISPLLRRGVYVVCDRYIDSGTAYQNNITDHYRNLMMQILGADMPEGLIMPELTIYLDVPMDELRRRVIQRRYDTVYGRTLGCRYEDISRAYSQIIEDNPSRFVKINAMDHEDNVHKNIMRIVRGRFCVPPGNPVNTNVISMRTR